MKKELPDWVFKKWHSTGITQHTWNNPNSEEFISCTICGVNKMHGGDRTLCHGMQFEDWLKNTYPELKE